jgi:phosphatidylglycerol---prolipoprotein diacylglyceryl transferase
LHLGERFGLRWYGLAYLAGFLIAFWLLNLYYRRGRSPMDREASAEAIMTLALGVLIGGRLGYVLLYNLGPSLRDPLSILQVWKGGMASHGGFAGVLIAGWIIARKAGMSLARVSDILATLTPSGLLLGRIANFINGELWGKISDAPWAVIFPASAAPGTPIALIPARHPSQLYEAGLEGAVLLIYTQLRFWKSDVIQRPGVLSGEFLALYGVLRIAGEYFREPDAGLILGMSRGIFYSLFLILAGIGVRILAQRKSAPAASKM